MTTTVIKHHSEANEQLKKISIRSIKDVRALDVDLMLVLVNGDRIIINNGALDAMGSPDMALQFADGQLPLARVFQQIDQIDVSPEANLTVSSKEITRYNKNNTRTNKAREEEEEEGDKPVVVESGERDPSAAADKGGGNVADQDMHEFGGFSQNPKGNYDIGNVRILYQVDTGASNLNPTFNIKFDARKANVGDVMSLVTNDHARTSKVLTAEDLASPQAALSMKIATSLPAAYQHVRAELQEASGNVSHTETVIVPLRPAHVSNPVLSGLKVGSPNQADAKLLNDSATQYVSITETGTMASPGSSESGLVFSGKVDGAGASDQYLLTVKAGEKVLAFDTVKAGNFTLTSAANLLAPGVYDDLSVTATNITAGNNNGATTSVAGLKLGSFWAAQALGDTRGGNGDDHILLGATKKGVNTLIQANGGHDTFTLGAFGKQGNFAATVTDFSLGVDKLAVFGKNVDALNLDKFVKEVAPLQGGAGTRLVIDLDGAGAGTQTYTLQLHNVAYNPANTHTLFGV